MGSSRAHTRSVNKYKKPCAYTYVVQTSQACVSKGGAGIQPVSFWAKKELIKLRTSVVHKFDLTDQF